MTTSLPRILRNYRSLPPTKFHNFNQKVRKSLADNQAIPESTWGADPSLLSSYFTTSDKHDEVFHEASYGSILVIAEREILQKQLVHYLDQIASALEAAAVNNPSILLSSGFDLAKERRSSTRSKTAKTASEVTTSETTGSNG